MRVVDFADMLKESINEKIKECKDSIHKLHNPIYNKSLEVEIEALEWAQGQIQDLVGNSEPGWKVTRGRLHSKWHPGRFSLRSLGYG